MQFPIKEKFELSEGFLEKYKNIRPNWGFNGLGEVVFLRTYSRIKEDGKNEMWWECIKRVVEGLYSIQKQHIKDYNLGWNQAKAQKSAQEMYDRIFTMKMIPNGRCLWNMGMPTVMEKGLIEALFNCSFVSTKDIAENPGRIFAIIMDFLMLGVGVGFDTQGAGKVEVKEPKKFIHTHVIPDSREGWYESVELVINSYFGGNNYEFDYSEIRPEGQPIKGFGGISSGYKPLEELHIGIRKTLDNNIGSSITITTIANIGNMIGKAVVSGNVRRCLPKGTLIHTRAGLKEIQNVSDKDFVYTSKGLKKVKQLFHQGKQDTIFINTNIGTLECTSNHNVAVLKTPYEYEWKQAKNITTKDNLVFLTNIIEGTKTSLPDYKYERTSSHSTTCKDIIIPELDTDISWFFGNFHGDGYVYPNYAKDGFNAYVSLALSPDYQTMIDFAEKTISRFGVNVHRNSGNEKDRSTKLTIQSKQLAFYLAQFKTANTEISIPSFIKEGTKDIRAAYLAGLFDADGSSRTRPISLVSTVYKGFAKEIQSLYASLGIPTRIKEKIRKEKNWKNIFLITLVGEKSIQIFEKTVSQYSIKYRNNNKTNRSGNDYTFTKEFLNNSGIKTYTNFTNKKFDDKFLPTDLVPIKIINVESGQKNVETFDLEIHEQHEFISNQGFLVHNSAEIVLGNPVVEFLDLKDYQLHPERMDFGWASNNSVYAELGMDYKPIEKRIKTQAEPGLYWLENARKYGRMKDTDANYKDSRVEGLNP